MNVLVIPDLHNPFCHKRALSFVQHVADSYWAAGYAFDRTVFLGDIADQYFASRFQKDPMVGVKWEIERARKAIQRWYRAFPEAEVCIGNHDERIAKRCEEAGIPGSFLKAYDQMWNTPGWDWQTEFVHDGILYTHGTGFTGMTAPRRAALEAGQSVVFGHLHKHASTQWVCQRRKRKQIFGMNAGCLCDEKAIAFAYGKEQLTGGVLGCAVVLDGVPYWEPMA